MKTNTDDRWRSVIRQNLNPEYDHCWSVGSLKSANHLTRAILKQYVTLLNKPMTGGACTANISDTCQPILHYFSNTVFIHVWVNLSQFWLFSEWCPTCRLVSYSGFKLPLSLRNSSTSRFLTWPKAAGISFDIDRMIVTISPWTYLDPWT